MYRRLALAPLGALLVLAMQPAAAQGPGCVATADLGVSNLSNWKNTIRVTSQEAPSTLCFEVVQPSGAQVGQGVCETLISNQSVTYSVRQIYQQALVTQGTPLAPNVIQVFETSALSIISHHLQATFGSLSNPVARVPLLFTCPNEA